MKKLFLLTNSSYRLLKYMRNNSCSKDSLPKTFLSTYDEDVEMLLENEFISSEILDYDLSSFIPTPVFSEYKITSYGIAYIQNRRHELFSKWIPYIITTAIAVIALATSIISLYLQYR